MKFILVLGCVALSYVTAPFRVAHGPDLGCHLYVCSSEIPECSGWWICLSSEINI